MLVDANYISRFKWNTAVRTKLLLVILFIASPVRAATEIGSAEWIDTFAEYDCVSAKEMLPLVEKEYKQGIATTKKNTEKNSKLQVDATVKMLTQDLAKSKVAYKELILKKCLTVSKPDLPETQIQNKSDASQRTNSTSHPTFKLGILPETIKPSYAKSLGLVSGKGVLALDIEAGSIAEKSGLQVLDVIVEVMGQAVDNVAMLQSVIPRIQTSDRASIRVWRQGKMIELFLKVEEPGNKTIANSLSEKSTQNKTSLSTLPKPLLCFALLREGATVMMSDLYEMPNPTGDSRMVIKSDFLQLLAHAQSKHNFRDVSVSDILCGPDVCVVVTGGILRSSQLSWINCQSKTRDEMEQLKSGFGPPLNAWSPSR